MEQGEEVPTNDFAGNDSSTFEGNVETKTDEELNTNIATVDVNEQQHGVVEVSNAKEDADGESKESNEESSAKENDSPDLEQSNTNVGDTSDNTLDVPSHASAIERPSEPGNEVTDHLPEKSENNTGDEIIQSFSPLENKNTGENNSSKTNETLNSDKMVEDDNIIVDNDVNMEDSNIKEEETNVENDDVDIAFGDEKSSNGTPDDIDVNVISENKIVDKITNVKQENSVTNNKEDGISNTNIKRQFHTIVLPSYSSWFDIEKIHSIEQESMPEFFQNVNKNKTPEIYVRYRNFMINSYRLNPNDYLSFTAVRRNLIGDAGALLRVHKFLNKWGLINYQVNPETRPEPVEPPYTGDFVVDLDTPRGMFPFESYKPPSSLPDLEKVKDILKPEASRIKSEEAPDGEPLHKKQKILKPDLDQGWDEKSLEKLVEGVSKFKNDWYRIAEYVGNGKTPNECIIRFLQLPIEDKFLENNKEYLGPLKYVPNLSFSPKSNPILSTLAFLVNMVDSDVAAAASNRAIKVIDKKLEKKLNRFKIPEDEQKANDDPLNDIKDAAANAFGIIGAKSHLFASYEEIEMHKSLVNIIQYQAKIVDVKLAKCAALEKEYELQRKSLEKKSNDLLEQKLSIFKYNNAATSKLLQAIQLIESAEDLKDVDTAVVKDLIKQSKDILYKPPRKQLNKLEEADSTEAESANEDIKPISLEAPMLYRYWSG